MMADFEFVAVQPGRSKGNLRIGRSNILAAGSDHLVRGGFLPLLELSFSGCAKDVTIFGNAEVRPGYRRPPCCIHVAWSRRRYLETLENQWNFLRHDATWNR